MKANDPKTAFDVLWEIESFPLYLEAAKEEAAREEGGDDKEKEKKKSSKDKDKDKKKSKVLKTDLMFWCPLAFSGNATAPAGVDFVGLARRI